jgi:hypothetical protein
MDVARDGICEEILNKAYAILVSLSILFYLTRLSLKLLGRLKRGGCGRDLTLCDMPCGHDSPVESKGHYRCHFLLLAACK